MRKCVCLDLNPSYKLSKRDFLEENPVISRDDFDKYLTLRELEGISKKWFFQCKMYLEKYIDYVDWKVDENKTLNYYQLLKKSISTCYYIKEVYQIRKFLNYLNVGWANDIKLPADPLYLPKRITIKNIKDTLTYFKNNQFYPQAKALIFLSMSSGARALEVYQLTIDDIDIENRILHINHNPKNEQSTKTKISRVSFFNKDAKRALEEYLTYLDNGSNIKVLFSVSHISRLFRNSPLKEKDLCKYFSQEWDRRGGPTSIKKILMGHSLKGDVALIHYNAQSPEDLKRIYDKVMSK